MAPSCPATQHPYIVIHSRFPLTAILPIWAGGVCERKGLTADDDWSPMIPHRHREGVRLLVQLETYLELGEDEVMDSMVAFEVSFNLRN